MPTMSFPRPSTLDPLPRRGLRALTAALLTAAVLGLGSLWTADAQAHVNRCVTLKGTPLGDKGVARVLKSRDSIDWQCLRIIGNHSLTILDLSSLTSLTYLKIEGNENLAEIKFFNLSNLRYLYINDNKNLYDNNDPSKILDLSGLTRLTHLHIKGNKCLTKMKLPNQPNLTYLHIDDNDQLKIIENLSKLTRLVDINIENNDQLKKIGLDNLVRIRCMHIKNNNFLEEISASRLADSHCIHIKNNTYLETIDFPVLDNVIHFHIEGNQALQTVDLLSSSQEKTSVDISSSLSPEPDNSS